ncbi:hypothetical protein ACOSQ3_017096 [Xanthoceras sorbifolium]
MLFWYYEECISSYPSDVQVESQGDKAYAVWQNWKTWRSESERYCCGVAIICSSSSSKRIESAPKCTVMLVRMQLWMFEAKDTNIDIIV